jgi:hypothetical protein
MLETPRHFIRSSIYVPLVEFQWDQCQIALPNFPHDYDIHLWDDFVLMSTEICV